MTSATQPLVTASAIATAAPMTPRRGTSSIDAFRRERASGAERSRGDVHQDVHGEERDDLRVVTRIEHPRQHDGVEQIADAGGELTRHDGELRPGRSDDRQPWRGQHASGDAHQVPLPADSGRPASRPGSASSPSSSTSRIRSSVLLALAISSDRVAADGGSVSSACRTAAASTAADA